MVVHQPLSKEKMNEIEHMIVATYQDKTADMEKLWKSCKTAISKKCQVLCKSDFVDVK